MGKAESSLNQQREKYLKKLNKQNEFLSQKYIDGMKADFNQKLSQSKAKKFKKNIRYYGVSPPGAKGIA